MSNKSNSKKKKNTGKKTPFSKTALIAGILVVAIIIGFGVYAIQFRNTSQEKETTVQETESSMKPHLEGAQGFVGESIDHVSTAETTLSPKDKDKKENNEKNNESSSNPKVDGNGIEAGHGPSGGTIPVVTAEPIVKPTPSVNVIEYFEPDPVQTITFPYAISGTDLVVQQISPYSGYYLEDGSDRSVDNIAAIVVTNNGEAMDFVGIGISQGLTSYAFSGSQIPAHSTVIIQEQTGAELVSGDFNSCTATVTESSGTQTSSDIVQIVDNGNNTFTVANTSEETIPEVTVYFKNYLPDEDVYVGGITYHITLEDIEPGTGVEVNSGHYASGYSVIVDMDVTK